MRQKTVYYEDEVNDDFSGVSRRVKHIPANYTYNPGSKGGILAACYRVLSFIVYRILMMPIAFLYMRLRYGVRFVGREKLRAVKDRGVIIYGNHTLLPGDGFLPTLTAFPKKVGVLVHPDSVALPGTETFMKMIGAIPIPTELRGIHNLCEAIEERLHAKEAIMIYPEAHIWPYYNGVRHFPAVSFHYPIKFGVPCYVQTVVYRKRFWRKLPAVVCFVDGPFYASNEGSRKERQEELCERVFETMESRTRLGNCEYIHYEHSVLRK